MLKNMKLIKQREYSTPIRQYFEIVTKKIDIYAVLLFGSVARGDAKSFRSYESDIDIIVIIKNLPHDLGERMLYKLDVESGTRTRVQSIWMTPQELEEHIEAKSDYILEAFECGIILFDPEEYLARKKSDLFMELKTKGVSRLKWGWSWNIKAGEVVEL
ncbi:MAG: nucleotidyltransferase domain-containing protein [Candidatus Methanoperedens sp.]|nr:nucleotidyltransferase domain-containing protein [Candidatus Methanoperedens sp.]MCZ7405248.1 nucleotidyltransferase domain-containing protein [Candidatus Methanoperedens sp.]